MRNLRPFIFTISFLLSIGLFGQRGQTGDKTFADKYPPDVISPTNTYLEVENTVDHDIIVCIRDQNKKYLNHVYIRNNDKYIFTGLPISRIFVQYKSKEFFFEDKSFTVINFGERHNFSFFFDASKEGNFIIISEKEFFKP
ncbi:MAG: hypothetical protein CND43_03500 [Flavobacteriales bacterium MED-G15]|nr:MAG: hypothetical protein CND43_03500 [Flavobacteriales bacterium MED-G15]|tara:strand:- start:852 stop:1274 length:423 start_codon:yes stop_codon:yes gene_type:complete